MATGDSFIKYSDFIVPDDSIEQLIELLEKVNNHMDNIAKRVPVTAEQMAKSIKKVTGVTVDGEDAIAEFSVFINKLEKAYRDLAFAQSDFGKSAAVVREQTKEATRNTIDQYKNSKMLKGSIDALNVALKEYSDMYKALDTAGRKSILGSDIIAEIQKLTKEIGYSQRELRITVGAVNDYIAAQVRLGKQQNSLASATADYNARTAILAKQHKQNAAVNNTEATSIAGLKARIDQLTTAYKALTQTERESSTGQGMLDQITQLTVEYEKLNAEITNTTLSTDTMGRATRKLALAQSDQAAQVANLNALAQQQIDLNRAQAKLDISRSSEAEALATINYQLSEQNKQNELYARLKANNIPLDAEARKQINLLNLSYEQLTLMYQLNAEELKKLAFSDKNARAELEAMQANIAALVVQMENGINSAHSGLNKLGKDFNGLQFSVMQLLREAPSLAVSTQTFFLAISNNLPMVAEQIQKITKANKLAKAAGLETTSAFMQIVKSLKSLNFIMVAVTTLLTFFGADLLKLIGRLFAANTAVDSHRKALRKLKKELKETSDEYGKNLLVLRKLQLEWTSLSTTAEKTTWIKNNTSEFNKLGIAINSVNEADNAFIKNSEAIVKTLQLRARATAAENIAVGEYEKALSEGTSRATLEEELAGYEKTLAEKVKADYFSGTGKWTRVNGELMLKNAENYNKIVSETLANDNKRARLQKQIERSKKIQAAYEENAAQYLTMNVSYEQKIIDTLKEAGITPDYLKESSSGKGGSKSERNIEEYIRSMFTNVLKKANTAAAKALDSGFAQQMAELKSKFENEEAELNKIIERNNDILAKKGAYANVKLTEEQRKKLEAANLLAANTLTDIWVEYYEKLEKLERDHAIQMNKLKIEGYNATLELGQASLDEQLNLQKKQLAAERQIAVETYLKRDKDNRITDESGRDIGLSLINEEYAKKEQDLIANHYIKVLKIMRDGADKQLEIVEKGSDVELDLLLHKLDIEEQIALAENQLKPLAEQLNPEDIEATYAKLKKFTKGDFKLSLFEEGQGLKRAKFEAGADRATTVQTTRFDLEEERDLWAMKIKLAEQGMLDWSKPQIETAKPMVANLNKELKKLPTGFNEVIATIGEYGPGGALLHAMGLDNEQVDMMKSATDTIIGFLKEIADAEIEAAEKAVEAAEKRVEAAKEALDFELEARANGYANNVERAREELQLEKENQAKKQKILEEAQRRQEAIDTITQTSSLITATAQLWSSFAKLGVPGMILAGAAIATMFGSFAAAKIKAREATSQAYGEGGLEILQGGSHASGHDIDLGVNNSRHKRMRAEGGEALAIISKKRTRQYRDILPGIIDSLNKGTFEQSYSQVFDTPAQLQIAGTGTNIDLSRLEREVSDIKQELSNKVYTEDGRVVIKTGSLTRIIRR